MEEQAAPELAGRQRNVKTDGRREQKFLPPVFSYFIFLYRPDAGTWAGCCTPDILESADPQTVHNPQFKEPQIFTVVRFLELEDIHQL